MKIIIIRSDPINPDIRAEKEAKSLAKFGHDVIVLGWDRGDDCKKNEQKNGYTIYRFKLKAPYGTISLIPYLIIWNIYILFFLIIRNYDVIHPCNLDTLIPSVLIGKIKRKKIVYDIFDFYGQMLPNSTPELFRNMISCIERSFSSIADAVILADESRIVQLGTKNYKKIEYIINTPEYVEFNERSANSKDFLIFYGGVLLDTRGIRQILEIVEGHDSIKLMVAGYGKDESILKPLFEKNKNVEYLGKIPYDKIIEYTYNSDLLFALYDPTIPNNKFASPNKLFEAMMCGKPIIVSAGTAMAKIVSDEKCGLVVNYENKMELKNAILSLKNDQNLRNDLGNNGRSAYEKRYNWNIMENRLVKLYGTI